jgi:regulator of replication initiation timing
MFSFTENITLEIPNVEEQLANVFTEAERGNKGLIIEVAAIHEGLTNNNTFYSKEELESALESWVTPYPKPVLINHDPKAEPLGRVIAAKMDQEADGTPFIRLQLAVTDKAACEKIVSQRYLTGSVGGKAKEAVCSICGENWSNASSFSAPCKHARGKVYKGKTAYLAMKGCEFKEYSWVNMPADGRSGVKEIHADGSPATGQEGDEAEDEGWVRSARIFSLSMDKEEVMEYTESEQVDILLDLKKKDASNQYMQMKGAFLNALASELTESEEEDILAISETLSDALATTVVSEEESDEGEETDEEPSAEEDETDETAAEETENEEEDEVEEADGDPRTSHGVRTDARVRRSESQEKAHKKDIDPERSTGAPLSRLSDENPSDVEEANDSFDEVSELSERIEELESQVTELEAAATTLREENAKLKAALKRGLVERVVDTKITLGIVNKEDRAGEIDEHLNRSASSLADSLKDLMHYAPARVTPDYRGVPTIEASVDAGYAVGNSSKEPIEGFSEESQKVNPVDFFTDVFMDRKKLY